LIQTLDTEHSLKNVNMESYAVKSNILHVTYVDFVATQSEVTKNQRKIKHFNYFPLRRRTISKDENSAYIFGCNISACETIVL